MKPLALLAIASLASALPIYEDFNETRSPKIGWCGNRPCITKRDPVESVGKADNQHASSQIGWCGSIVCITKRNPKENAKDNDVTSTESWSFITKREPEGEGEVSAQVGWCGDRPCITKRGAGEEDGEAGSQTWPFTTKRKPTTNAEKDDKVNAQIGWCGNRPCITKRNAISFGA